jgi:tRNA(Ile)-lysidine synthase
VARTGRYAALAGALAPSEVLLTAHHLEDQLETVLLQLLRGAGLPGLSAMPALKPLGAGFLARPLLSVPRAELRAWVQTRGLRCLEDPANADASFDRNYLRHSVLPLLVSRWPGAAGAVARSARHVAAAQELLDGLARSDVARAADGADLSVAQLRGLPLERRRNALRFWIAASGRVAPDARRLEEMAVTLLAARVGANPVVSWGQARVQRHAGRLILQEARLAVQAFEITWNPRRKSQLTLPSGMGHLELLRSPHGLIDAAALPAQVTVRTRRGGERLRPRAGGPERTLKSLLQKEAVSLIERQYLPLLFAGDHLVAAGDLWVDARWQAGAETTKRMRLIWHRPS